jgi:predicted transcriptional regulator
MMQLQNSYKRGVNISFWKIEKSGQNLEQHYSSDQIQKTKVGVVCCDNLAIERILRNVSDETYLNLMLKIHII